MVNPDELLCVGRTNGAYGVRGSIRVVPFEGGEVLAQTRRWFLTPLRGETVPLEVTSIKVHGNVLLATVAGCDSKEKADALRGRISVLRADFPDPGEDEFWAADVIGCRVVNREGVELGRVTEIGSNTVQDIFKVEGGPRVDGRDPVYLIPDVEAYILDIDVDSGVVTVDWQPDWI